MPDYTSLRLRLSVRTACVAGKRAKTPGALSPAQAALVGGFSLVAAWTGGTAMAQVGELANTAGLLQPVAAVAAANSGDDAKRAALATEGARRRAIADQRRVAALTLVRGLAAAAGAPAPSAQRAADLGPALDGVDQALAARSARLNLALRTLGLSAGVVNGADQDEPDLVRVNTLGTTVQGLESATAERIQQIAARARETQALSARVARLPIATPVANPVRSSPFGGRADPFTGQHAFHAGQDFAGARMTRIAATAPGIVSFTGQRTGYGNTVEVDHGGGFKTRFAHLAQIGVRVGQAVARGDRLGGMGSTGRSTGTHLHYEVWVDGRVQNPDRFLRAGEILAGTEPLTPVELAGRSQPRLRLALNGRQHPGRVHARYAG